MRKLFFQENNDNNSNNFDTEMWLRFVWLRLGIAQAARRSSNAMIHARMNIFFFFLFFWQTYYCNNFQFGELIFKYIKYSNKLVDWIRKKTKQNKIK